LGDTAFDLMLTQFDKNTLAACPATLVGQRR
jgi:hypothetical protein